VNHTWAVFSFVGAWQNYQKRSGLSLTIAMVTGATLPGRGVSCLAVIESWLEAFLEFSLITCWWCGAIHRCSSLFIFPFSLIRCWWWSVLLMLFFPTHPWIFFLHSWTTRSTWHAFVRKLLRSFYWTPFFVG